MTRCSITAVLLAVLALGATGCGGDHPDDASATRSASTSSTSGSATGETEPSEVPSEPAPVPGGEGGGADAAVVSSMQVALDALVDPDTTTQQKADRIVGGSDLAPVFGEFAEENSDLDIVFSVHDPVVDGRRASALVASTSGGDVFAAPAQMLFVLADGEWRLERRTVCAFLARVGFACPPR